MEIEKEKVTTSNTFNALTEEDSKNDNATEGAECAERRRTLKGELVILFTYL